MSRHDAHLPAARLRSIPVDFERLCVGNPSTRSIEEARGAVIQGIAGSLTAVRAAGEVSTQGLYKVVLKGGVPGDLAPAGGGLFHAFVRGDKGKIVAQAKLTKVAPNFVGAAATLAAHLMVMELHAELDAIKTAVFDIKRIMKDSKIAKIQAAATNFLTAQRYTNDETARHLLVISASNLNDAVVDLITLLKKEIADIPDYGTGWFDGVWIGYEKDIMRKLNEAEATLTAIVHGIQILSEINLFLKERSGAAFAAAKLLELTMEAGIAEAARKARKLPPSGRRPWPEQAWVTFQNRVPTAIEALLEEAEEELDEEVRLELSGEEVKRLFAASPLPEMPLAAHSDPSVSHS